jgi:tetratricopeptide (TPR) repeat protein
MKLTLLGQEKSQPLINRKTNDVEAYELYLQGRSYLDKRTDIEQALLCFNKAIEIDPNFAAAYTSIAYIYFYKVVFDNFAPRDGFPKAAIAIQKALSLDNSIAEAHTMQGLVDFYFHHRPDKARMEYEKALLLQPNFADTYRVKSYYHVMMLEEKLAVENVEKCHELDPLSFNNCFSLGDIYYRVRRYKDAVVIFEKLAERQPEMDTIKVMLGVLYYLLGNVKKAKKTLDQLDPQSISFDLYGNDRFIVAAKMGDLVLAKRQLKHLLLMRTEKWIPPTLIASLYFSVGDIEKGMQCLHQALKDNDPILHMVNILPLWADYKNLPGVQKFLHSWQPTN